MKLKTASDRCTPAIVRKYPPATRGAAEPKPGRVPSKDRSALAAGHRRERWFGIRTTQGPRSRRNALPGAVPRAEPAAFLPVA